MIRWRGDKGIYLILIGSVLLLAFSLWHGHDPAMKAYMAQAPNRGDLYILAILIMMFRK